MDLATQLETHGYAYPVRVLSKRVAHDVKERYLNIASAVAGMKDHPLHDALPFFKPHILLASIDEAVHNPRLLDAVSSVLGPLFVLWSSDVFQKRPGEGELAWHQDSLYFGFANDAPVVRAWLALSPATGENGALRYVPGSHRQGTFGHIKNEPGSESGHRASRVDVGSSVHEYPPVLLEPGEAVFHHLTTVHASGPNRSHEDRIAVAMTYAAPGAIASRTGDSVCPARGTLSLPGIMMEPRPRFDFDPRTSSAYEQAMSQRIAHARHQMGEPDS